MLRADAALNEHVVLNRGIRKIEQLQCDYLHIIYISKTIQEELPSTVHATESMEFTATNHCTFSFSSTHLVNIRLRMSPEW